MLPQYRKNRIKRVKRSLRKAWNRRIELLLEIENLDEKIPEIESELGNLKGTPFSPRFRWESTQN
jgi:hypothetical protein